MTTGTAIANRRRELNISQKDLAQTLGISTSYLCKIERDKYDASAGLLAKIHNTLNVAALDEIDELEARIANIIRELESIQRTITAIRSTNNMLGESD